jgi:hypothetical protein
MKSIATQISETQDALIASGKFTADSMKEAVKDCINLEHRLSVLKGLSKKNGIKESVELRESRPRIERKNGRAIQESGDNGSMTAEESRIEKFMLAGRSYQEAFCLATGKTTKDTKEPAKFTEARKERLKKAFKGVVISEQDLTAMASRQIEP